jgi:hypothetical protein
MTSTNYLTNRVHTYPITNEERTKELNVIQDRLCNNEYNKNLKTSHLGNHRCNKNTSPQHQTTFLRTMGKKQEKSQDFSKKQTSRLHSEQKTQYKT